MNVNNDEPAFPVDSAADHQYCGMSLRDYFAVHAQIDSEEVGVRYAEAIVGRDMPDFAADPIANSTFWADYRARMRYIEADAMLAARSN